MNKADFIKAVAEKAEISNNEAHRTFSVIESVIIEAMARKESVQITGFGTFEVRHIAARPRRNPQTGETKQCPAKDVVKFKVGSKLKDSVK